MALTASMAVAGVCAAAGDGTILNKEQKAAETFFAGLNGDATVTYAAASATLVPELKTKITADAFAGLQKNVKEKLGNMKEAKFRRYEHFDDGDRVLYVGKYSKAENVAMVFAFNTTGKIVTFNIAPINVAPAPTHQAPAQK